MNKKRFFDYCRKSIGPLSIHVGVEYRGDDRQVTLWGNWLNCTMLDVVLYTPTPGRQHRDCYAEANRLCDEKAKMFQRWLDEFLKSRTTIANVGDRTKINNDTQYQHAY